MLPKKRNLLNYNINQTLGHIINSEKSKSVNSLLQWLGRL